MKVHGTHKIGRFKKIIRLFILTLNCSKLLKKNSSSNAKYRAIACNVKENQNDMKFVYCCLGKINQSELSILLVTMIAGNQAIRIQHFPKKNSLSFLKTLIIDLKNFYRKTFEFPRVTLQKKRKNST